MNTKIIKLAFAILLLLTLASCHTHNFSTKWTFDSTYHYHKCNDCDERTDFEAHSFTDWQFIDEATYLKSGLKERKCSVCGYEESMVIPVIAHTHNFTEYVITKEATLTSPGIKTRTCKICGKQEEKSYVITKNTSIILSMINSKFNLEFSDLSLILDDEVIFKLNQAEICASFDNNTLLINGYSLSENNEKNYFILENDTLYVRYNNVYSSYNISNGFTLVNSNLRITLNDIYSFLYAYKNVALPMIEDFLTDPKNEEYVEDLCQKLFVSSSTDNSYTLKLNNTYLVSLLKSLTTKKLFEAVTGKGTYDFLVNYLPYALNVNIGSLINYLDELGIDINVILNQIDYYYYYITGNRNFLKSYLEEIFDVDLSNITIKDWLLSSDMKKLNVRAFLINLGISNDDITKYTNQLVMLLTDIKDYDIYKLVEYIYKDLSAEEAKKIVDDVIFELLNNIDFTIVSDDKGSFKYVLINIEAFKINGYTFNISNAKIASSFTSKENYEEALNNIKANLEK